MTLIPREPTDERSYDLSDMILKQTGVSLLVDSWELKTTKTQKTTIKQLLQKHTGSPFQGF